ncbi:kinase-like domain-containing protein, partial [Mycena epipterygia]
EQFVAKRFFWLSEDTLSVSVEENGLQIQAEIFRLAWGQWFLNAFYAKSVISLAFADAFLAKEVDQPSIASGVLNITEGNCGLTWLVERKRPTTVTKYSGTLVHTSACRDLKSLTVCAFAHFVFRYSDNTLVFADLQVRGGDGLVLFDLMTHTRKGDSGVGDFGTKGMETFMNDHECNSVCSNL